MATDSSPRGDRLDSLSKVRFRRSFVPFSSRGQEIFSPAGQSGCTP